MTEVSEGNATQKQGRYTENLRVIWSQRRRILYFSLGICIVTLVMNFFVLQLYYKAKATLLPEADKTKSTMLSSLAGLADIASSMSPVGGGSAKIYPTIVTSETVLDTVVLRTYKTTKFANAVNLVQYFDFADLPQDKALEKTLEKIRGLMTTSVDVKTGVFTITLEMPEPVLAAEVLNTILGELDRFMRERRISSASEQVKWISTRMADAERDLRNAEEAAKNFRLNNRKTLDSPELSLAVQRLDRDVQLQTAVVIELRKQYEIAKIDEVKNLTIVNIMDPAKPPVQKERPHRLTNGVLAFVVSLVIACFYVGFWPGYRRQLVAALARIKG